MPLITSDKEAINGDDVEIFIQTNGVHTDIVMPAVSEFKDWTKDFPYSNTKANDSSLKLVAIGWGDKGFYLETPTWDQLKASTAIKAAFGISGSAIHATYYSNMKLSRTCKSIKLSKDQYLRLVKFIDNSLVKNKEGENSHIITQGLYGINDAFYDAKGRYSIFYSCNTWSNDALKSAGQKACLWTVLQSFIFEKYNEE
jgi:uncharacterized protein (TIGR02117 family)